MIIKHLSQYYSFGNLVPTHRLSKAVNNSYFLYTVSGFLNYKMIYSVKEMKQFIKVLEQIEKLSEQNSEL